MPQEEVNAFIDEHRVLLGSIRSAASQVARSVYRRHAARQRSPALLSQQGQRDAQLLPQAQRVYDENLSVYGADKGWKQPHRKGRSVARCTVERRIVFSTQIVH